MYMSIPGADWSKATSRLGTKALPALNQDAAISGIPNLKNWWCGEDVNALYGMLRWRDRKAGALLAPPSAAENPSIGGIAGRRAVRFNGTASKRMSGPGAILPQNAFTQYIVLAPLAAPANGFITTAVPSDATRSFSTYVLDGGALAAQARDGEQANKAATFSAGVARIVTVAFNGFVIQLSVNGGAVTSYTPATAGFMNYLNFHVGSRPDVAGLYLNADVAEILIFNDNMLTTAGTREADHQAIISAMRERYAIA